MPVIVVTGPALPAVAGALADLNASVAQALDLPPTAVHSMFLAAQDAATGAEPGPPWPTAILHGSNRPATQLRAALAAATTSLARSWGVDAEQTWVQWQVRAAL